MVGAGTIGHRIGQAGLAMGAVIGIGVLMLLALIVTLLCAPPLKAMAERVRDQAP